MEYYCVMVLAGEEKSTKERILKALKEDYPTLEVYYFERQMFTEKRGWFKGGH